MSTTVPSSIIPQDEPQRIAAVRRYDILDTPPDGAFERVTALAARRFNAPISIISIVDTDRIWFKSHHGLEVEQIGRDPGLCASAILKVEPHLLSDARSDVRSLSNPLVAGDFGLRFYAGVPLRTSDGYNLGTLCVIDKEPRPIDERQIEDLKDLASLVMDQLELRLSARRSLAKADHALEQSNLLAREIDHRVMNSLQFVSSLLHMQGKSSSGADAAEQFEMAASRVAAVARVHRHFHVEENAEVAALPYLKRLCDDMSKILNIPVNVTGDNGQLPTTAVQPLGLVVNELITNSAKNGAREISVSFKFRENSVLTVTDDGNGLPPKFDPAKGEGLGMKILNVLSRQLGGTFSAGANPSRKGARFEMTFPSR